MKKIIFKQTLVLCISLTMHYNAIKAMKTPSQKLRSEANVSCYICNKEFARKDYLTKHMNFHVRKKSYSYLPLETRIINSFTKEFNTRVPQTIPTQHFTYMPLESLPFETAIQELEWIK